MQGFSSIHLLRVDSVVHTHILLKVDCRPNFADHTLVSIYNNSSNHSIHIFHVHVQAMLHYVYNTLLPKLLMAMLINFAVLNYYCCLHLVS